LPNLAKSWEWSEDGTELTMHLIKGAKWSDGTVFTSRDVLFTWEDMILDPNVQSWTSRSTWQIDGKDITLEALDAYTIQWTFPESYPVYMLFNMDFLNFSVAPAHVLKRFHPRYNQEMDYFSFENCLPPEQLPTVTMGPWVPVRYEVDQLMILRRNPYYWKVDEAGKQLPYLDEVTFVKGVGGELRTLGTIDGSFDHTNVENPGVFGEVSRKMKTEEAPFHIEWGPELLSFPLILNISANLGVENEQDKALRQLFRDLRFRRALSHAIDREGLAKTITKGPFLRPFPGGLFPGCPYFESASVVYYPYHQESAKELLAELGFKDSDNDGVLNWTNGPWQGKNLEIQLEAPEDAVGTSQVAEVIVEQLAEVGITVHLSLEKTPLLEAKYRSGRFEMAVIRSTSEFAVPFTKYTEIAPVTNNAPDWHRAGDQARELLPFEEGLVRIVQQFIREPDFEKQKTLMFEYNKIFTENCYIIGTVIGRYGLALAKRFQNVPVGSPAFFYQWAWDNVMPEQIWVKPEEQLEQLMPNTLPWY
jgi:peptide/nickel transport system substrate-binding protein